MVTLYCNPSYVTAASLRAYCAVLTSCADARRQDAVSREGAARYRKEDLCGLPVACPHGSLAPHACWGHYRVTWADGHTHTDAGTARGPSESQDGGCHVTTGRGSCSADARHRLGRVPWAIRRLNRATQDGARFKTVYFRHFPFNLFGLWLTGVWEAGVQGEPGKGNWTSGSNTTGGGGDHCPANSLEGEPTFKCLRSERLHEWIETVSAFKDFQSNPEER